MGGGVREVSTVLATLCILIWEMYSFVNIYQAVHYRFMPFLTG